MLHCKKCGVDVAGERRYCPLCQNELVPAGAGPEGRDGEAGPGPAARTASAASPEVYPLVPTVYRQYHFLFRLLIFASIAVGVAAVAVNLLLPESGAWSAFVAGGIACLWLSLALAVRKRRNIPKGMLYQVAVLSVICVLWDLGTGWHGWSIDYVVPILCASAMIALGVLSKVFRWDVDNLLIYFCIDALFGVVPIVFYFAGWVGVPYPSVICVAMSVLCMAGLAVFRGNTVWAELKRRLHV